MPKKSVKISSVKIHGKNNREVKVTQKESRRNSDNRRTWNIIAITLIVIILLVLAYLLITSVFYSPLLLSPCEGYFSTDYDGDGLDAIKYDALCNKKIGDNCPTVSNRYQTDSDRDGVGNECDWYPYVNHVAQGLDRDKDSLPDSMDSEPDITKNYKTPSASPAPSATPTASATPRPSASP